MRENIGDAIVALTGALLVLNMFVIIFVSVKALQWRCHLRKLKNKALKDLKKRLAVKQASLITQHENQQLLPIAVATKGNLGAPLPNRAASLSSLSMYESSEFSLLRE